jgi:hypothetical protein
VNGHIETCTRPGGAPAGNAPGPSLRPECAARQIDDVRPGGKKLQQLALSALQHQIDFVAYSIETR